MGDNPFADLIPQRGSEQGGVINLPVASPTPVTTYSIPASVGGADESYDSGTAQGYGSLDNELAPGVVAVNPSVYPIGTIFKDADTGEAFVAGDKHGNANPNVIDIYTPPSQYTGFSGQRNLVPVGRVPANEIPKTAGKVGELLKNFGRVPEGEGAYTSLGKIQQGSQPQQQQMENPFSDLIPQNEQAKSMGGAFQSAASKAEPNNPFADLIPSQQSPSSFGSPAASSGQSQSFGNVGPDYVPEQPWYSALPRQFAASAAKSFINTIGGELRGLSRAELTPEEAKATFDKSISDQESALNSMQAVVDKKGFSTADDQSRINQLKQQIENTKAQKQTILSSQQFTPQEQADLAIRRQEAAQQANLMSQASKEAETVYGANPQDTSAAAGIGRGLGNIFGMTPAMLAGGLGIPLTAIQAGNQAYAEAYDAKVNELKKNGVTDQKAIDDAGHQAGSEAAVETVPQLGAYLIGGKLTSEATGALLKGATPLVKGFAGGAAAAGVNVATSAGLRGIQSQPLAPTAEGLTQDILFGALHGVSTGMEASAEAKRNADAKLGGPAPEVKPSANPVVNQREQQINAAADAQAPAPEVPKPAEATAPAGEAKTPAADLTSLLTEQLFHDEGSPEWNAIQAQIDAIKKPAGEAPSAPVAGSPENKNSLNARAKALGYNSIEQFNTQNVLRGDLSPEESQLLKDYGDHNTAARNEKDPAKLAEMDDKDFDSWIKTNTNLSADATIQREKDLDSHALALEVAKKRGDQRLIDKLTEKINQSGPRRFKSLEEMREFDPNSTQEDFDINQRAADDFAKKKQEVLEKLGLAEKPAEAPAEAQPTQPNAIQEPSATEAMLRPQVTGQGEVVELSGVGEQKPEVPAKETEAPKEEVVAPNTLGDAKTPEEVDAFVKAERQRLAQMLPTNTANESVNIRNKSDFGKRSKGLGMEAAAKKRQLTGNLTAKEAAAKANREASNYIGKPVSVDGKNGTIIGNPFGRVKVRFSDGTESTHLPEKVEAPVKITKGKIKVSEKQKPKLEIKESAPEKPQRFDQKYIDGIKPIAERMFNSDPSYKEAYEKSIGEKLTDKQAVDISVEILQQAKESGQMMLINDAVNGADSDIRRAWDKIKKSEPEKSSLETWADNTIKESKKRLNVGLDPEVLSAYAVKGAFKIARGVRDFGEWSKQMLEDFGEAIRPHLEDLWNQAKQIHAEREQYTPKAPTEQEAFAKKAADAILKGRGTPITQDELANILSRKFPGITSREASDLYATATGKPKAPAPYAGVAAGQGQAPFGISEAAQQRMVESGELTHVSPSAEPVTQQERLTKAEQALDSGADPEQVIRDLQAANIPDKIAQGMVFANKLKNAASEALRKYGYNSPEFKEAQKAHQDYQDRLKEAGSSQAGSALNIVGAGAKLNEARLTDPYDFANAFHDQTKGQDMTLSQIDKASKLAERNKKAEDTTNKAQEDLSTIRDEGFSDVDVKTPETLEEAREQVSDLSDIESKTSKEEVDRLNNELEKTKKDLEELKQSAPKTIEELRSKYEKEKADLQKQLEESQKVDPLVKRILDKVSSSIDSQYEEALKRIAERRRQGRLFTGVDLSELPDHVIVGLKHFKDVSGDFAKWSARVVKTLGEEIKPYLDKLYKNSEKAYNKEIEKTGLAGKQKAKPVEKKTPAEKTADSLRKRIDQTQKKIDDLNSGKITTPKEVEKVTNDEIKRLESEYEQKKKELSEARAKVKQNQLFPKGKKITGKLNIEQAKTLWESAKKFYIPRMTEDPFYDEHRLISDIADDFGLSHQQVRDAFAMPKGAKKAANNLFLEQQKRKQVLDNSRRWLIDQSSTMIGKLFGKAAEQAFKLSVLGHGTAFITTHALPLWATHPILGTKAFLRAMRYTFTGKSGRSQWIIDNHDIVNHPDYEWAIKGGADVNPFRYGTEKPQRSNPDSLLAKALDPITGGRGFDALHWMRMQYFSKEWRKLSPAMQNEEMAKVIGDAVNTATGYSESKFGSHPIVRLALFAPKLYKSQFKWLIGDPARMLGTVGRMAIGKDVSPADAWQARHEAVNKAKFLAMYAGALGLNALILKGIGSNAQINFTDPKKHDWLAFKTNDGSFNPLHPFIAIGRLLAKETHDLFSDYAPSVLGKKTPLEKSIGNNVKLAAHDLADYAFSKLSPIARDAAVLVNQRDFAGNAVPWSSVAPLRGKEKLTWPQFLAGMFAPIPFAEASSQKEWLSPGAGEKLGSALIFGVPYETREDEERWAKSHSAKTRGGSSSASSRGNQ